jgi:hypothetical protein
MQQMMVYQIWKQRREELLREAEMNRQVKAVRATGKRRAGRSSALAWELRRHAGPELTREGACDLMTI